jgi:hypothetical protein
MVMLVKFILSNTKIEMLKIYSTLGDYRVIRVNYNGSKCNYYHLEKLFLGDWKYVNSYDYLANARNQMVKYHTHQF